MKYYVFLRYVNLKRWGIFYYLRNLLWFMTISLFLDRIGRIWGCFRACFFGHRIGLGLTCMRKGCGFLKRVGFFVLVSELVLGSIRKVDRRIGINKNRLVFLFINYSHHGDKLYRLGYMMQSMILIIIFNRSF
jgi:hypothetical protein